MTVLLNFIFKELLSLIARMSHGTLLQLMAETGRSGAPSREAFFQIFIWRSVWIEVEFLMNTAFRAGLWADHE